MSVISGKKFWSGDGGPNDTGQDDVTCLSASPGITMALLAADAIAATENDSGYRKINLLLKRLFDIIVSAMALVLLFPFFVIISIFIRLETPGSALFTQERYGRGQNIIRIFKFRTMYTDKCDSSGVIQAVSNDARVTKVGKILRNANIDELPQLFNVLRGDMSLVGPRCHPVGMLAVGQLYEEFIPHYHTRHLMLPGITGLAQANGFRGQTVDPTPATKRIENDIRYIATFSFFGDLKIITLTVVNELFVGAEI